MNNHWPSSITLAAVSAALALVDPSAVQAQGLFKRAEPLTMTITTDLNKLVNDRDSTKRVAHAADLVYKDANGADVKVAVVLRTRGHFRRQFRNCEFPPLHVELTKEAAKNAGSAPAEAGRGAPASSAKSDSKEGRVALLSAATRLP